MEINDYINEINTASKNGKLVFFVGAGISTLSGYPQWWQLVNRYYTELYGKNKTGDFSSDDYLRIPQIFHDVNGAERFDEILKDVFSVENQTNEIHDKIVAMNPVHIITTNYDDLIDKACLIRGRYFSLISSDEDVAQATSSKYLLKVHGDFSKGYKGNNVVLKESDYVNYEQNYALVSNLMKTIMATHTVVFIGYGLGDYNINLLLNWVKKLQKEGYNKPFFIRTDPKPIEINNRIYYENKGLRILDAASIQESLENEYMKRYSLIMDLLIDSRENSLIKTDNDVIEYVYQKISPLFELKYIRKQDLKHVFEFDYHFEVNGIIYPNHNKGFPYLERFFNITELEEVLLSEECKSKFEVLKIFFANNEIVGMYNSINSESQIPSFDIKNLAYHGNYDELQSLIKVKSKNIESDYKKAFYLAYIGDWEAAYNLYTELLLSSIDEENWCIHYLSQINRFRLSQSIIQAEKYGNGPAVMRYGKKINPFSEYFIIRVKREMKNFNISDVYAGMPYEFQTKYRILEFLSDSKFLYDDTVILFELTNKIRSEMSKGSYAIGNLTAELEVYYRLKENIRFLYNNYLWLVNFKEFKQYIRNSITLQLEKAEYDQNRDSDDFGFFSSEYITRFVIDYYDFVNIAKAFNLDDVKYIERNCNLEQIEFHDIEKIDEYLVNISDTLINFFSENTFAERLNNQIVLEAKVAIYFAKYVPLSSSTLKKLVQVVLTYFPENELDIGKKYFWVERLISKNGLPEGTITIMEQFIINQANKHKDENFKELSSNGIFTSNFKNLIVHFKEGYVSTVLSEYVLEIDEKMTNQLNFIYDFAAILTENAREHLINLKKIETIEDLMNNLRVLGDESIFDHQDLIEKYMDNWKEGMQLNKSKGVTIFKVRDYAVTFSVWYFNGHLENIEMKRYLGHDDQVDFFINPIEFDYSKFKVEWLKSYSNEILEKIAITEYIRPNVIELLKERIKKTNNKKYVDILINFFVPN